MVSQFEELPAGFAVAGAIGFEGNTIFVDGIPLALLAMQWRDEHPYETPGADSRVPSRCRIRFEYDEFTGPKG